MLHVSINGTPQTFQEGGSVLDALRSAGIEVPTLCHDERLKPYGGCRLCVVQLKGWPRPVTACTTPLAEGLEIETHTAELEDLRRTLLRLLAERYPADAVRQFSDKQFHRYVRAYGLENECLAAAGRDAQDESHPYIQVDMFRCVYCYRCVRICEEVQGQFVWRVWNRGDATEIRPDSGTTLLESSCVSCGACVDTCPTGALEDKSLLSRGVPTAWTRTTCAYCGTGCEMDVGTRESRIVSIKPTLDAPVNRGHLCVKGRYAFEFVYAADRVTEPMIRQNGAWQRVSWDDAISFTADALRRTIDRHGADSIGVLGSARGTNEENYLAQKFARVVLGTNNVDCCARVCHAPTAAAMKAMLGTGAATNSFDDIEKARTILICGANPTENHPVVGARIKQAVFKGARLIVIDPRQIEIARYADCHLQLRPGTNVPLLNAMAHAMIEEHLCDDTFLEERVRDWGDFRRFITRYSPEEVASVCGVEANLIRKAARIYATEKPALCVHGLGVTEHTQGTEGVMCLVNLALLTGNIGRPGTGINPLRGQNNVQGSAHMGCDPSSLTGAISLADGRALFERAWRAPVPSSRGLNLLQMMDAAVQGKLKALWAIGYDILLTNADAHATRRALESMDFVIVQDMFLNQTAREFGSVFLPAASSFEKDGTFMNAERRVQRVRKVIDPIGQSKTDWEIIGLVARALGKEEFFKYHSSEAVWDEIRSVWEAGRGITYSRLDQAGLQWPCPSEDHPGTEILHTKSFLVGSQVALRRIEYRPTPESTTDDYPFLMTTGRTLYQFNAGTMTARTRNAELRPRDLLDISPEDAWRLGLQNGDRVRLRSRYGEAALPIQITPSVHQGQLFATFHTAESFLNAVTSSHRDGYVHSPEYKVTAVHVEKLKPSG